MRGVVTRQCTGAVEAGETSRLRRPAPLPCTETGRPGCREYASRGGGLLCALWWGLTYGIMSAQTA